MLASQSAAAPPQTMTKMNVRVMGPDIKPGSYAALPKLIYRAGAKYARMENAPDARSRIEKITIIAEPDAYSIDMLGHTGTHAIDQGGPNDLHLPMVLPFDPRHRMGALDRLEFGDELEFFEKSGAVKSAGPIINGQPTDLYALGDATLITRNSSDVPVFVSWKTKEGTYKYEYSLLPGSALRSTAFSRPNGIKFREIQPPAPGEVGE